MPDLSDLQVYKDLIRLSEELDAKAERAMSVTSSTAIKSAAAIIRLLASAVYKNGL